MARSEAGLFHRMQHNVVIGRCRFCTFRRSVDTSRIRDILKEEIGKLPAKVEPVGESRGGQELSGQVGESGLAGKHEAMDIHRRDQPKPSQPKEGGNAIFVKERQ